MNQLIDSFVHCFVLMINDTNLFMYCYFFKTKKQMDDKAKMVNIATTVSSYRLIHKPTNLSVNKTMMSIFSFADFLFTFFVSISLANISLTFR